MESENIKKSFDAQRVKSSFANNFNIFNPVLTSKNQKNKDNAFIQKRSGK